MQVNGDQELRRVQPGSSCSLSQRTIPTREDRNLRPEVSEDLTPGTLELPYEEFACTPTDLSQREGTGTKPARLLRVISCPYTVRKPENYQRRNQGGQGSYLKTANLKGSPPAKADKP